MPSWGQILILVTTGTLTAVGTALYTFQQKLIYMPNVPEPRTVVKKPSEYGLDYEDVWLTASDGTKLHAFLMLHGARSHTLPTVAMFQANAGSISHRLPLARAFHDRLNCNVLMLSYRGYGMSEGAASEAGIRLDARAAIDYLRERPETRDTKLVLYGQSIGSAVAIDLAATETSAISGVIVENAFTSLPDLIPHVLPPLKPFLFLLREYWRSIDIIDQIGDTPILFLSGARDQLVPPAHMTQLHEKCTSKRKRFVSLPEGTHNDTCIQPLYWPSIRQFLNEELQSDPGRSIGSSIDSELDDEGATAGSVAP